MFFFGCMRPIKDLRMLRVAHRKKSLPSPILVTFGMHKKETWLSDKSKAFSNGRALSKLM